MKQFYVFCIFCYYMLRDKTSVGLAGSCPSVPLAHVTWAAALTLNSPLVRNLKTNKNATNFTHRFTPISTNRTYSDSLMLLRPSNRSPESSSGENSQSVVIYAVSAWMSNSVAQYMWRPASNLSTSSLDGTGCCMYAKNQPDWLSIGVINCRGDASQAPVDANLVPNPVWIVRPAIKSITSGVGNQSTHTLPASTSPVAAAASEGWRWRRRRGLGWDREEFSPSQRLRQLTCGYRLRNSRLDNFIASRLQPVSFLLRSVLQFGVQTIHRNS